MKLDNGERISLEKYIDRILREREAARIESARVLEVHLENLNHWKEESLRDRERMVSKELYLTEHQALHRRVEIVEGKYSRLVGIGIAIVALTGIVGLVLGHLWK